MTLPLAGASNSTQLIKEYVGAISANFADQNGSYVLGYQDGSMVFGSCTPSVVESFYRGCAGPCHLTVLTGSPRRAVTASYSSINIHDLETGKSIVAIGHASGICKLDFIGFSSRIITAADNGELGLWDAKAGPKGIIRERARTNDFCLIPFRDELVRGGDSAIISSATDGKYLRILLSLMDMVRILDVSKDGSRALLVATNGDFLVVGLDRSAILAKIPSGFDFVSSFGAFGGFIEGRNWIYAISANGDGFVWDLKENKQICRFGRRMGLIKSCCYVLVDDAIGTLDIGGNILEWCVESGRLMNSFHSARGKATALALSPCGFVLAVGYECGVIELLEIASRTMRYQIHNTNKSVRCIGLDATSRILAAGYSDSTICVWKIDPLQAKNEGAGNKKAELKNAWKHAMAVGAREAIRDIEFLIANGDESVRMIGTSLCEPSRLNEDLIRTLVGQLNDQSFRVRDGAERAIEQMDVNSVDLLLNRLDKTESLETKRRVSYAIGEMLRRRKVCVVRSLEILEKIGTEQALACCRMIGRDSRYQSFGKLVQGVEGQIRGKNRFYGSTKN
jgi:hypothetical protein